MEGRKCRRTEGREEGRAGGEEGSGGGGGGPGPARGPEPRPRQDAEGAPALGRRGLPRTRRPALTGVGDVEAAARGRVVRLELQAHHVAAAGQLRRHLVAGEGAEDGHLGPAVVLHGQEVELWLHVEVVEDEVHPAARRRDDQPHAVHVVAVLLGVVGRQDDARGRGEVEEARDCGGRAGAHPGLGGRAPLPSLRPRPRPSARC